MSARHQAGQGFSGAAPRRACLTCGGWPWWLDLGAKGMDRLGNKEKAWHLLG